MGTEGWTFCLSMAAGNVAANVLPITRESSLHRGSRGMESIFKGSLWELVRPHLSPDVVVQLRVTARCWNIGENYGPFGAFFFPY